MSTAAIKVLRGLPPADQEENYSNFNADELIKTILDLSRTNEKLLEELRVLEVEEIAGSKYSGIIHLKILPIFKRKGLRAFSFLRQAKSF